MDAADPTGGSLRALRDSPLRNGAEGKGLTYKLNTDNMKTTVAESL
jgi:hypothetical protein